MDKKNTISNYIKENNSIKIIYKNFLILEIKNFIKTG